jgi:hypothetical protein
MPISASARIDRLRIGWREYGEVRCEDCGETVDLSEAATLDEAMQIWNDHVEAAGGELYV